MTKAKPQLESNIAIELPADAVEILSNGKNAYIHMNGTVYRVIEESKYWKAISAERQRILNEVEENLKFNQPKEFDTQTFRNYIAVEIDKLRKLNEK